MTEHKVYYTEINGDHFILKAVNEGVADIQAKEIARQMEAPAWVKPVLYEASKHSKYFEVMV